MTASTGLTRSDVYACHLDSHAQAPKVRAFIDHMVNGLKGRWSGA